MITKFLEIDLKQGFYCFAFLLKLCVFCINPPLCSFTFWGLVHITRRDINGRVVLLLRDCGVRLQP